MAVTKESTLFQRVASGGQDTIKGCLDLLSKHGYDAPQSRQELAYMLAQCCVDKGDQVLKEIAVYHPDKEFILENIVIEQPQPLALPTPAKRNDTGNEGGIMPAPGSSTDKKVLNVNEAAVALGLGIFSFATFVFLMILFYKVVNK